MKYIKWLLILSSVIILLSSCGEKSLHKIPTQIKNAVSSVIKIPIPKLAPNEALERGVNAEKDKDFQSAFAFYKQAADQGNAEAEVKIGFSYLLGRGINKNLTLSFKWFLQAATQGHAIAQYYVAKAYLHGNGAPKNFDKALEYFEKSANNGYAFAQDNLAALYNTTSGSEEQDRYALKWAKKAAINDMVYSQFLLGWSYHHGKGVKKNIGESIKWLDKAIQNSMKDPSSYEEIANGAKIELASIYDSGDGIRKNKKRAFLLIQSAANNGSLSAKISLADKYASPFNKVVKQDLPVAIRMYAEALEKDSQLSDVKKKLDFNKFLAFSAGQLEYKNKHFKAAFKLLSAVANQEDADAQAMIGKMYWDGIGIKANKNMATTWWRRAAEKNQPLAMESLGEAYWDGEGLNQDKDEALKFLLLSSKLRHKNSINFIEKHVYPGWHFVSSSGDTAFFVNKKRIRKDRNIRWYWDRAVPLPQSSSAPFFHSEYKEAYIKVDCTSKMYSLVTYVKYNENGVVINSHNYPISMGAVTPNSIGESKLDYVCNRFGTTANPQKNKVMSRIVTGTGWPVRGGYVVTNHHVVAGRDSITLFRTDGQEIRASVIVDDATNDLVILKPKNSKLLPPALPLAITAAQVGGHVFTIGYPHPDMMGKEPKLTEGIINARTGLKNDPRVYQISVPLQGGNSGGPLLNMSGEVIGITTAKMSAIKVFKWTGDLPQNVNYAVKVGYLRALLSSVDPIAHLRTLPARKGSLTELAKRIEGSVLMVVAQ